MDDTPITWEEVRNFLEFFGWTTLVLTPFLYWVNRPAVSEDQYVIRCLLVACASICAVGIRGWKLRSGRNFNRIQSFGHTPTDIRGAAAHDTTP
ncbi:MAG: hypothetical protein O2931_00610 [Planctomycetota bacterium]|nr:hypothetical protein [Planctomycetota bacterium]MDA1177275.1 hypothetical protein [Planctomycetota bacterium]